MDETPEDIDVLLTFGELAFQRGDFQNAQRALAKAARERPNSRRRLQLLGTALHALDRRAEAIECFLKILQFHPQFRPAYTDIAIVLWEDGRRREALSQLARALERWPHFSQAAELYERFHEEFGSRSATHPPARAAGKRAAISRMLHLFHGLPGALSRIAKSAARNFRAGRIRR